MDSKMPEASIPVARLLVVDDEPELLRALCDTLQRKGYAAVGFNSGQEALAALRSEPFDLLISDLMMPDMDGIALLKAGLAIDPDLVGIIITGAATVTTAVQAMQSGAFDYIRKPFNMSVILPVLTRALAVRQLRLQKRELERRVRERTAELEAANKELEAFAFSVSHDLRAPLRAIKGFSGILMEDHTADLSAEGWELLQQVVRSAGEMQELIEDLLRLARLGRHTLVKEPVDMQALARAIADDLRQHHEDRVIDMQIGNAPKGFADTSLLRQVFINLLSNAFKFTRERDCAVIEVGGHSDGSENVYFVRDNGAGFDMQYASRLFQPFQRLHNKDDFEGTGIGLSIVQRIVARHGGRIWAQAEPAKGATFFFTLPKPPDSAVFSL